jgi:transposase
MHHRRTVGPVIPCQVASPQSLTLFHQAGRSVTHVMRKRRSKSGKVEVESQAKTKLLKEREMNLLKYIGMDVHKATTVIAVLSETGKVLAEAIVETKAHAILDFIAGQRGTLHVVFEEGTQAAWLYDLIRPHVANVVVCDPRKITTQGNKGDKPDARRLAELLRSQSLKPVYHGERSTRTLKELAQSYDSVVADSTRVKNRLKALFRGRGIDCGGSGVYDPDERRQWLGKLDTPGVRARGERLWKELDCLVPLCEEAEKELLAEGRKHVATKILRGIPGIGPVRAAVIVGVAGTPNRFRTKRQFWSYCGLGIVTKTSSEYIVVDGQVCRSKRQPLIRGLNHNYNRALKWVFKGAAKTVASGPWKSQFDAMVAEGKPESLARLTLARKVASIALALWKKGERYDHKKLRMTHAA